MICVKEIIQPPPPDKSFLRLSSYEQKFSDGDLQEYTDISFANAPGLQFLGV